MKTTIDLPDDLLRRAKAEAALSGRKLRELVAEALRMRLQMHAVKPATTAGERLFANLDGVPLIKASRRSRTLAVTPKRIHDLEMQAELKRNEASLR